MLSFPEYPRKVFLIYQRIMKVLRIYQTKGRALICKVYPALDTAEGGFISPNEVSPLTLTMDPSREVRFSVRSAVFPDSQLIAEIERFCATIKQMYEL